MFDIFKKMLTGEDKSKDITIEEVLEVLPETECILIPSLQERHSAINLALSTFVAGEIFVDEYKNIYVVSNTSECNGYMNGTSRSSKSITLSLLISNDKRSYEVEYYTFNNIEYENTSSFNRVIKEKYANEEYDKFIKSNLHINKFTPIENVLSGCGIAEIFVNNIQQYDYAIENYDKDNLGESRVNNTHNYTSLQELASLVVSVLINKYQERPKKFKMTLANTQYSEFIRADYKEFDCTNDKEILRTKCSYSVMTTQHIIENMKILSQIIHAVQKDDIKFKFLELSDISYINAIKSDIHNFNLMSSINKDREQYNRKATYKFRDLRTVFDYQAFYELHSKTNEKMPIELFTYIDWRLTLAKNPDEKSKSGVV